MERLTKRESANVGGRELVLCNHKKEDCNDSCMYESGCKWQHKALRKLKEYEDAEEQGLLLKKEKAVDDGYLQDWYIHSVTDDEPIWTEAHLEELFNDFILIPKEEAEQALTTMKEV